MRLHQVWGEVENPRGWLYRSLRNLALNHRRDHRPEAALVEDNVVQEATLPADRLGHEEALGTVRLLLAELPTEDRDLVRLKYVEELKYREISRRTGVHHADDEHQRFRPGRLHLRERHGQSGLEVLNVTTQYPCRLAEAEAERAKGHDLDGASHLDGAIDAPSGCGA